MAFLKKRRLNWSLLPEKDELGCVGWWIEMRMNIIRLYLGKLHKGKLHNPITR